MNMSDLYEGLSILLKYGDDEPENEFCQAEHDEAYFAGPPPELMDLDDFLEFCGGTNNGFNCDGNLPIFLEEVLQVGEIKDYCDRMIRLDTLLPIDKNGKQHPLYFICLMWLESLGLIERDESEGGLQIFELTEVGELLLKSLRARRAGFN